MAAAHGYIGRSPSDSSTVIARQSFSPTGIQTDFTFAAGYEIGYVDLYLNGARLVEGQDFSATDGSTVGLTTNAVNGDVLEVVAFKAFNATNVSAASGNFTVSNNLNVSGVATVTGAITATGGVVGDVTGNATGLSGTPDLTIRNLTGVAATFTGIVSYDDVVNVDSVGFATFRSGINVQGAGSTTTTLNVSGVTTMTGDVNLGADFNIPDAITHVGDSNTKIRFPAADTFTVETSGAEAIRVDSDGHFMVGQTSPYTATGAGNTVATFTNSGNYRNNLVVSNQTNGTDSGSAVVLAAHGNDWIIEAKGLAKGQRSLAINSGSTEALRVNFDGNVGIGTTVAGGKLQIDGGELLVGTKTVKSIASTTNATAIFRDDAGSHTIIAVESSAASGGGTIALSASRNNTDNGYTIIQNNDVLGEVRFAGDDGTNLQHYGARIKSAVDGSPAENNMPGRLEFHTNSGGETTAERLRIDSSGRLKIGTISNYSAGVTNAPVYIAMQSDITGIGDDEGDTTAGMVRIEETGSNDGRYHGIDLRNKNSGDIRLLNSDRSTNDRGDLILVMPDEDASDGTHLKMRFNSLQSSIQISGKGGAVTPNSGEAHTDIYIATKTGMTAVNTALGTEVAGLIRFEDRGTNDNRYHGIELRNRNSGDARILNLDEGTTNKSNLVFAIDNGTTVVEAMRLTSTAQLNVGGGSFVVESDGDISTNVRGHGHIELDSTGSFSSPKVKLYANTGNAEFAGTVSDSKGDLRKIIYKQETSAYTLVAADAGKAIEIQGNLTVPNSVFAAGDAITIINDSSTDKSILKGTGLSYMFNTADGTNANRTLGGRGMATIYFVNATTCYISGSQLS